ncbi:MAG TPA: CoA transferase [Amycolatopsis sp.]|nr:CoA transferase [Amycolatopsis sp.]
MAESSGALSHLRICDLSGQLAGAGATRFLAAFGAQVIRVEDPVRQGRWDILRGSMPYADERRGVEFGGAFNNHNVGKLGVTVNLRNEQGRALLSKLIAVSDVVTENFAAGVMAKLGFSYEEMRALKPDLVYVSNSGFGSSGPYSGYKTFGPIVQACSGLTFTSGVSGLPPAGWGYSYMDHMGAYFMALGVLAGLAYRNRTGEGQWVDMSCVEAGIALAGPDLLDSTVNGNAMRRDGYPDSNHSHAPPMAPHGIYPASGEDDWVAIACRGDQDWASLAELIDEPWAGEARWSATAGRVAGQRELDELIAGWTGRRDRHETVALLRGKGVPVALVARPRDRIDDDPAATEWGLWPTVEHPAIGAVRVDGLPVHLSATDWSVTRGAPLLGEHNDYVFGDLLGLSGGEIAALRREGAI